MAAPRAAAAVIAASSICRPKWLTSDLKGPASLGGMGASSTEEGHPVGGHGTCSDTKHHKVNCKKVDTLLPKTWTPYYPSPGDWLLLRAHIAHYRTCIAGTACVFLQCRVCRELQPPATHSHGLWPAAHLLLLAARAGSAAPEQMLLGRSQRTPGLRGHTPGGAGCQDQTTDPAGNQEPAWPGDRQIGRQTSKRPLAAVDTRYLQLCSVQLCVSS